MKKIFAVIMTVCLMASLLCVTAFAADASAEDVVLRVSALKRDDTTVVIKDYTVFEDGWNAAMELAVNSKDMNKNDYARVIVDIYADWNANKDGEFTESSWNGKGFNWDAIYFRPNVRMTLNLNGHTINRGLTEWEYNGEVMYIDKRADVIINEGTITGGFSCNGAGGIHVNGANVELNNVNVIGNSTDDDDGAGIAIYDGANLTMNGGTIVGNKTGGSSVGGGIYVNSANATLNDVLISDNELITSAVSGQGYWATGAGCCVTRGTLTLNNCTVKDNHSDRYGGGLALMYSGDLVVNNCTVTGNSAGIDGSAIAIIEEGNCLVDSSDVTGNENTKYDSVFYVQWGTLQFSNTEYDPQISCWDDGEVIFADVSETFVGSLIGQGNISMLLSLLAIITAGATFFVVVNKNKKLKVLFAGASNEADV